MTRTLKLTPPRGARPGSSMPVVGQTVAPPRSSGIEMTTLYADATRLRLATGNEVEAFVRIKGDGISRPRCLLLHGNPGCLLDWEKFVPRVSGVADIAAIDLPGFGKSLRVGSTPESLSLVRLAEQAILAADALGWRGPIFLIGHSHGGGVAQAAAARYPDRVAGLVLIGTLGAPVHGSYRLLSLPGAAAVSRVAGWTLRSKLLRPLNRMLLRSVMFDMFSPEAVPPGKLDRELALLTSRPEILVSMVHVTLGRPCAQLFDSAPNIRCPTLFLHGSEDVLNPARYARSIHERIMDAGGSSQFHLVPGAGHMLIDFQATDLANVVLRWLVAENLGSALPNSDVDADGALGRCAPSGPRS
jgi:pimeloyl-ACP methyl ester carboxylesterase